MKSGKVILSIVTSLAAGAALGVLFAPKKGIKTRKGISKQGENITEDLEEKYHALLSSVKDKYASLSQATGLLAKTGIDKPEKVLQKVSPNGNKS